MFPHRTMLVLIWKSFLFSNLMRLIIFHNVSFLSLILSCTEHHPIEYAIDGTNRWWQSPSIKNGMGYHYVTITLDLKQVLTHTHTCPPRTYSLNWFFLKFQAFTFVALRGGCHSSHRMTALVGLDLCWSQQVLTVTCHSWNQLWAPWINMSTASFLCRKTNNAMIFFIH